MSVAQFEHFILAKPYFDRKGLLVVESDRRVVGFVHAGFGPNQDCSDSALEDGVICMVQMHPEFASKELAAQLLTAAEAYLAQSGSQRITGGPHPPQIPFYHGLCGSGELPGVLLADVEMHAAFKESGYSVKAEFAIMECQLGRMRGVFDRNQRILPRSFEVRPTMDHSFGTWWETCAFGPVQRSEFQVVNRADNIVCGSLMWWDLEPITETNEPGVALSRVEIVDDRRRAGLATFLVSNALKQLKSSGAFHAQVQVPAANAPAIEFFVKLGFEEIDRGVAYEKRVS